MLSRLIPSCTILVIILLSTAVLADEIVSIKILNKDFDVIKTIRGHRGLAEFQEHWNRKEETAGELLTQAPYKIDIYPGDRWLYNPEGYVRVLSKRKVPTYKLSKPEEFNRLLGISGKNKPVR